MEGSDEREKDSPPVLSKRKFHENDPLIVSAQAKRRNKETKLDLAQKRSKKKEEKVTKLNVESDEKPKEGRITNARSYQTKILAKALQENTIAYLETGCGKTLIAILLIKEMASSMREKNQKFRAVFMAPTVCLVLQQTSVLKINLDLQVECYYGAKDVDKWSASKWKEEMNSNEVLVMTPMVLLDAVRHGFVSLGSFHLLIFDECHRAQKKHEYAKIMREYYHNLTTSVRPRIFGMTASPVTSKGVMSAEDSAAQMLQLEKLLDAKVSTVEDDLEVQRYVPTPNQKVRWFLPPTHSFHTVSRQLESLMSKYEGMYESAVVNSDGYKDVEELNKKLYKKLKKLHGCVLYSLEGLGLLCAYESALCILKKLKTDMVYGEADDESVQSSKETFLNEAAEILAASLQARVTSINTVDDVLEAVKIGLLSPKVSLLVNCLLEYRNTENLRCIVFVERVVTAMVLARILNKVGCLSFVKCSFLSGTTASLDAMGKKQQQSTLAEFHSGKLNVLVATDVAEEGLDVQKCSSVIRFDLSKTVRSFIQSRGRARMPGSDYIIFLEKDNQKQSEQLQELKQSEESMRDQALNRTYFSDFSVKIQTENVEVFRVETTGATVSTDSSISLISRFCANLPGDKFYRPVPEFIHDKIEGDDANHVCKLILPPNSPFRELIGPPRRSRTLSKQSVCLEACKMLHAIGQLTDHLIPVIDVEKPEEEEVMNLSGKNVAGAGTNRRKELHGTVTTNALCGDWINKPVDVSLYAYVICFEFCQKEDDPYVDFVLLLRATLDEDIANTEFPIFLSNGRKAIAKFFDAGVYSLSADQLEDAKAYHQLIFNGMFGRLIKRLNKKEGQPLMKNVLTADSMKSAKNEFWDTAQMYLVLPLLPGKLGDESEELPINWKAVRDAAVTARLFPHLCSIQRNTNVTIERKAMHKNAGLHMASGLKPVSELIGMAVVTIHTGRIYTIVEVLHGMNANCQMEGVEDSIYSSYSHYFAEKYKRVLEYPEQPLLRVKQSHRIHNLLTEDVAAAKKKESTEKAKKSILVELPAELCLCTGLPSALIRSLYLFPSVFHRFNALLMAAQLRGTIAKDMRQCNLIQGTAVMQALTTLRCLEGFSFEGLELLGDSFLKYAVSRYLYLVYDRKHEGQLSNRRSRLICNQTLHRLAVARHLPGFIRDEPFQPEYWKAPGMLSVKSVKCKCNLENLKFSGDSCSKEGEVTGSIFRIGKACSEGHRWMCSKTISDAVEALIGAFVSCGDSGPALGFMKWIGMDIDFDLSLYEAARNRKVHPKVLNAVNVVGIESQLGYVFLNKALLVEALTHASKEDPHDAHEFLGGGCYQRLEFLGDAILDFLITRHLFMTHPGLSPGVLSDLRSAAVNNECFARSAVKHNLQRYLRHGSGELLLQITNFVKAIEGANEAGQEEVFGWEGARGPKVLGDLVESIAGAILVDSGFDLERVWSVMVRILSPLVTPSTLPLHPIRELHELSQSKGLSFVWKKMPASVGKESTATGQIEIGDEVISETAKGQVKKTARKNAAQKILSALKRMGILHPRKEAADQKDAMHAKMSQVSEKRAFDGDCDGPEEKRWRRSFDGETSKDIGFQFREAQMLDTSAVQELPPVNPVNKELSSNSSSIKVGLMNSPTDQKSFTKTDMAPVQNPNETADELEMSINLKMSPTASRSEDETTSACCVDSSYMAKPLVHNVINRASYPENTLETLEANNLFRAQEKGLELGEPMELSIKIMGKGGGRCKLNEFCLKRKWPLPKYTWISQRDVHVERFIFTAEVDGPHGLFKGTSDAMLRKDQAKDHAAVQLLIALNQFSKSN